MGALGGTLELTSGADSTVDVSLPPTVCQKAAYWVTPDSTVVTGSSFVARWCDVREPAATRALGTTPTYVYAEPQWYHPTAGNEGVPPEKTTKHGRDAVYFGGHLAGRYLKWSKKIEKIQALFLVHGVYDTFGAVVGYSVASRKGGLVPQALSSCTKAYADITAYLMMRGDFTADIFSMTAFLDGRPLDVMTTKPIRGFQLLECHFAPIVTQADTFFLTRSETLYNDSNLNSHQGGDYLAEAIVFTNAITEAQRLDVERYLMKKWNLPRNRFTDVDTNPAELQLAKPVGTMGVAAGATNVVNVSTDEETPPLAFNGEGVVVKRGVGTLVAGADASGKPSSASLALEEGSVIARQGGRLPPLRLSGGSRYTAEAWNPSGTAAESSAKGGLRLTRTAEGAATQVVKDGDGWARANEVDADVSLLDVRSGVLQLEAKAVESAYVEGGAVTGFVANADFEQPFDEQGGKGWSSSLHYNTINGWLSRGAGWYMTRDGWAWNAYGVNADNYGPAEDNTILHFASVSRFGTQITVPVDGSYELTFLARNRCGVVRNADADIVQHFELCLGTSLDDDAALQRFASFVVNDGPMQRIRVRLPQLTAGTRWLVFRAQNDKKDPSGVTLDDLRLTLVGEREQPVAFAIPNGGAEYQPTLVKTETTPYHYSYFHGETTAEGWTFTDGAGGAMSGEYPLVGATGLSTFMNNGSALRPTGLFNYWDRPLGAGALAFFGKNGKASTSFAAPAGTYRLRAGISKNAQFWNNADYSSDGVLSAKLVLSDSTEINLGTVKASSHLMAQALWPSSFTIPSAQTVTLVLQQTSSALTLVDDLVFVSADENTYGELLLDCGFDDTSHDYWKRPTTDAARVPYTTEPLNAYGWTALSGLQVARMTGHKAHFYQTISVPCAGLYRLKVAARSRIDGTNSKNPLQFTIARNGSSVTNLIGRIDPMPLYRQFVGFEYLFRLDEPGDYTFSVKAVDHSASDPGAKDRQSFVDDFSITRVRETPATFVLPAGVGVQVASGAQLQLDFTNSVPVATLRLGGRKVYGVVDASTHPQYISGLGSFTVTTPRPGLTIIFR